MLDVGLLDSFIDGASCQEEELQKSLTSRAAKVCKLRDVESRGAAWREPGTCQAADAAVSARKDAADTVLSEQAWSRGQVSAIRIRIQQDVPVSRCTSCSLRTR